MTRTLYNGKTLALITGPALVVAAVEERPFDAMADDYHHARNVWREVPEAFYWEMLEVLPPIYRRGGFLVSEPYIHETTDGHELPVFAGLAQIGERFFTRYSTANEFTERVAELCRALAETEAPR